MDINILLCSFKPQVPGDICLQSYPHRGSLAQRDPQRPLQMHGGSQPGQAKQQTESLLPQHSHQSTTAPPHPYNKHVLVTAELIAQPNKCSQTAAHQAGICVLCKADPCHTQVSGSCRKRENSKSHCLSTSLAVVRVVQPLAIYNYS